MEHEVPCYVIFVEQGEERVMYAAPLDSDDANYFQNCVIPNLQPLSDEEYGNGPAAILHTLARFSYILHKNCVYWCIEWRPGLIVVYFSPDRSMAWTALRSPIPDFGRRVPTEEDLRDYDADAINNQRNLVINAWDAQFDEDDRAFRGFTQADETTLREYQKAFEHVDALSEQLEARYSDSAEFQQWMAQAKSNLTQWAGEGIRVKS